MVKKRKPDLREIKIRGKETITESIYAGNKLKLSRYTLFTLIPKNLFEQFHRTSNIWFLVVAIFQLIPFQLNPTDSWTTIFPLALLIGFTLVKDTYTDYLLRKKDRKFNNLVYLCWDGEKFIEKKSEDLLVGQFVLIHENEIIPADLIIVSSQDHGNIFLDITKLVGFTSLAQKSAVEKTAKIIGSDVNGNGINKLQGELFLPEPNSDYNSFSGTFKIDRIPGAIDLTNNNMLYRGGVLKGEKFLTGLIAYCGQETKLQLNTKPLRKKMSRLETIVNTWVLYILVVLLILVIFSVIGFYYIGTNNSSQFDVLEPFIEFTLLYNNIIPISLFMVIDIIRLIQSYIYSLKFKDVRFNTETVNENLGQVDFLVTDKTGSLTENKLTLKMCVIGDKKYEDNSQPLESEPMGIDTNHLLDSTFRPNANGQTLSFNLLRCVNDIDASHLMASHFIKCMALCHNLYKNNEEFLGSHEEIALVNSAKEFGYSLNIPEKDIYELSIENSGKMHYRVVGSRSFTREKKRSRILLEDNEGVGYLYVKGAIESMLPLMNVNEINQANISQNVKNMSERGLRTMVLAYKKIQSDEVLEIKSKIQRIRKSLLNPESRIEAMFKEIEKNLKYLGITGLSEELLPGTIDSINSLKEAGIKIWLVSSDSVNSTVIVAKQSGIIDPGSKEIELTNLTNSNLCSKELTKNLKKYVFDEKDFHSVPINGNKITRRRSRLGPDLEEKDLEEDDFVEKFNYRLSRHIPLLKLNSTDNELNKMLDRNFEPSLLDYSVIIDRVTLQVSLKDIDCRKTLTCLLVCAKSVCFVDLMPRDKGNIVKLLKENVSFMPLVVAVGSGEGDINMLQTSDVGIGISNGDDSLVLNYSDIVIKNFQQLIPLILIEGHWNYTRLSKIILLFLYKNSFLTMVILAFTFLCDFSGTSIFNASLLLGFNLFFTSLPILVIGVFDEDISYEKIIKHRQIYSYGINNKMFNWKALSYYLITSVIQGVILIVLLFVGFPAIVSKFGDPEDLNSLGTIAYITLVISVLFQIYLETYCYSLVYYASHLASVILLIVFITIITQTSVVNEDLIGVGNFIINSPISFFTIIFSSGICVIPNYFYSIYTELFGDKLMIKIKASYNFTSLAYEKLEEFKSSLSSLYVNTSDWKNKVQDEKFSMNKLTLRFNLPYIEKKFAANFIRDNLKLFKWTVCLLWVLVILWTIFGAIIQNASLGYTLSRIVITAACSIALFILWTDHFVKNYKSYILFIIFVAIVTKCILEIVFSHTSILATALVPSVSFLILNVDWLGMLLLNILNFILFVISISMEFSTTYQKSNASLLALTSIFFIIAIITTSSLIGYFLEVSKRSEHKLLNKAHGGVEKIQSILSIMLPPFVRNRVKEGARYIADDQGEVTIVFCDICDFDRICKEYPPKDLTSFLDQLFSTFDDLCENVGVTKIETVGKTYMACSGLKDSDKDLPEIFRRQPHARRAIELAFAIIQEVNSIVLKYGATLQVKIGINSGRVAAGVVGQHKPQFSLVGDTVNTASRMCSTLDTPNSIQISKNTHEFLEHYSDLEFTSRIVYAKGKGDIEVFKVHEAKPDNSDIAGGVSHMNLMSNAMIPSASTLFTDIVMDDSESKKKKNSKKDRASKLWKDDILKKRDSHIIQYSPLMKISFTETEHEKEFRLKRLDKNYYSIMLSLVIAVSTYFIMTILSISDWFVTHQYTNTAIIIGRSVVVIFLLVIIFLHPHLYKKIFYPYLIISCLILMTAIVMLYFSYTIDFPIDFIGLELMYIIVILNHTCAASLPMVLFVNVIIFIPWIVLSIGNPNQSLNLTNALLVAVFSIINFKSIHACEKSDRANHNLSWLADKEITQNEALLIQMMPPHVLENLQNGKSVTDRLINVTLIFADIVGFTDWSSTKKPEDIVKMLSNLFSRFDELCVKYDVYKVHTIGDCYVVMGHVGKQNRDFSLECLNVIKMARTMIDVIREENIEHKSSLDMRIGVHTGEIIAGVIGTNIVRYDIWGPDVLIANKMESNGTPGRIKVSEDTKIMLQSRYSDTFSFEESTRVEVPVIGAVKKSYFLEFKNINDIELKKLE